MRTLLTSLIFLLIGAVPASAAIPHVVQPGETLWSIAAANNFTTRAFAAANGLSEDANVVAGTTLQVPSVAEASTALGGAPVAAATGTAAPKPMGGYLVRPGDTLTGLAARAGVSVQQMAFMNGLDPNGVLLAGSALKLPTGAPVQTTAAAPTAVAPAAPAPTPGPAGADAAPAPPGGGARRAGADARPRLAGRHRGRRRAQRRPGRAGLGDRLAGERLQQRDGLQRQRARRHAGAPGHVGVGA